MCGSIYGAAPQLWEDKEGKKRMHKNHAKALGSLRQKIRKYNRDFEGAIAAYRLNPELSDDDEDKKSRDSEGTTTSGGGERKKEEKARKKLDRRSRRPEEEEEEEGEWEKVKGGVPVAKEKPKMFAKGTEIDHAAVVKKLNEILQARGKKGTDRPQIRRFEPKFHRNFAQNRWGWDMWVRGTWGTTCGVNLWVCPPSAGQIELLQLLVAVAHEHNLGAALEVKIKFNIIASLYDYNPNLAAYMKVWGRICGADP
ncbi:hypothetical protein Q9233_017813 [Columba guinea]|nr:hypothetical protein Q9233_017813 [Columba guinea]